MCYAPASCLTASSIFFDLIRLDPTRKPSAPRDLSSSSSLLFERPLSEMTVLEALPSRRSRLEVSSDTSRVSRSLLLMPTTSAEL